MAATPQEAESVPEQWYVGRPCGGERYIVGGNPRKDSCSTIQAMARWFRSNSHLPWIAELGSRFPDGTLVTVGYEAHCSSSDRAVIGKECDTAQQLWGVEVPSPDDVWAGGNGFRKRCRFVRGSLEDLQPMKSNSHDPTSMRGSRSGELERRVRVGQKGAILRWNGSELKEEGAGLSDDDRI